MTPQQIVGMGVRLFAVWLVIICFQTFTAFSAMRGQLGGSDLLYVIAALPALLAVLLWLFPMFVAHKIVPRTHDTNVLRIPARAATAAGTAIIGLWACIGSLPYLLSALGIHILANQTSLMHAFYTPERTQQLLATGLQAVFGLFLVAKPWFVADRAFPAAEAA